MERSIKFKTLIISLITVLVTFSFVISGCGQGSYEFHWPYFKDENNIDLIEKTNTATEVLLNNCNDFVDKEQSIIVTSLVNIDNIQKSSTYGRMSSEIIASKMAQKGYNVKEVKLTQSEIFVRQHEGAFALSRQLKEIAHKHDIQTLVVGTYALGGQKVNISLRVVLTDDNRITCAHSYAVKHNENINLW